MATSPTNLLLPGPFCWDRLPAGLLPWRLYPEAYQRISWTQNNWHHILKHTRNTTALRTFATTSWGIPGDLLHPGHLKPQPETSQEIHCTQDTTAWGHPRNYSVYRVTGQYTTVWRLPRVTFRKTELKDWKPPWSSAAQKETETTVHWPPQLLCYLL